MDLRPDAAGGDASRAEVLPDAAGGDASRAEVLPDAAGGDAFRAEVRSFLDRSLSGTFAPLRGRGGPGEEHALVEERREWERHLAAGHWTGLAWPVAEGGRGADPDRQLVFAEEYARAGGPGRVGHIGETLVGPTLIAFGTPAQRRRFLAPILAGDELWCQGYSEPGAGSDLAAIRTTAVLDGDEWVLEGQKVWTSLADWSDWCFVLARTDPAAGRHKGISYLLVPMRQPGIQVRPIVQLTGTSEFNEVFFTGARTAADNVVGSVGDGWRVAMATLAFERGVSTLVQVLRFESELASIIEAAQRRAIERDPIVRERIAAIWSRLRIMRWNLQRMLADPETGAPAGTGAAVGGAASSGPALITKLYWSTLHRDMGELAADVLGPEASLADAPSVPGGESAELGPLQRLFLFSRADTIYAGTSEIQRNLIGERALGLPKEPS